MSKSSEGRGVLLLCSRCGKTPVGWYRPEAARVRQRGRWITITPPAGEPHSGEVDARCDTCEIDGTIDLGEVARLAGAGVRKLKVRIRRVYG